LLMGGAALLATSCSGAKRYTVDESAYQVQRQRHRGGRPHMMVQAERSAARKMAFAGSSRRSEPQDDADSAPSRAPRVRPSPPPAPRPTSSSRKRRIRTISKTSGSVRGSVRRAGKRAYTPKPSGSHSRAARQQVAAKNKQVQSNIDAAPVVYLGFLRLRVKRRLPAVDRITKLVKDAGGYIQSLQQRYIIVRVPARDFEAAMKQFAAVGEVLDRQVKALDVSRQFTDLGARLSVFLRARERLLALLATTKDVEERLRIVQEVKRLSEQIESIESTLATLRNLVSYFTITIQLDPIVAANRRVTHSSPFPWIRRLQAHRTTIRDGMDELRMTPPKGFVLFDDDDDWRAQSADTSILRGGRLDNEPRGDSAFWLRAVAHELDGRDEVQVTKGTSGDLHYAVYKNKDPRPRYWLIGVKAVGEDLFVIEAFLPTEAAHKAHLKAVIAALSSFEVK